jgi:hypothetical protein
VEGGLETGDCVGKVDGQRRFDVSTTAGLDAGASATALAAATAKHATKDIAHVTDVEGESV